MAERRREFGFTLIELLVVISIIALLLSVMMPTLNKARDKARQIICLSNTKQMGLALMLYAQDNKGRGAAWAGKGSTTAYHWTYLMRHYLGVSGNYAYDLRDPAWNDPKNRKYPIIRACPSNNLKMPPYYSTMVIRYSDYIRFDYNNMSFSAGSFADPYMCGYGPFNTISQVRYPKSMVTFREGYEGGVPTYSGWWVQQPVLKARHFGGENFSFADGHSQWYGNTSWEAGNLGQLNSEIFKLVGNGTNYWMFHFHISPLSKP